MPNPTQADLHVNVPLTNVSVAYIQNASNFIASKIFPRASVQAVGSVLEVQQVRLATH